jgi:CGNR zinc finger
LLVEDDDHLSAWCCGLHNAVRFPEAFEGEHSPWFCVEPAVLDLLGDVRDNLPTEPDATKLRACHAPGCVLYFVKSHPRRAWCSEACGNRARAARHYERVRARKEPKT